MLNGKDIIVCLTLFKIGLFGAAHTWEQKTKSQKVLGAYSYFSRRYRGKTCREPFCPPHSE